MASSERPSSPPRGAILQPMEKDQTRNSSSAPSDVTVTITVLPAVGDGRLSGRPPASRLLHAACAALALALALVALGAIIATGPQGDRSSRPRGARLATDREKAAIAASFGYPYPLRCLTITISASDPDYARADVDRIPVCGGYHGYLNASFQRVGDRWRLIEDEGQLFVANSLLRPSDPTSRQGR
jgi:hypothetical protein